MERKVNFHILRSGYADYGNPCHNPVGAGGGQFCGGSDAGNVSFSSGKDLNRSHFDSWQGERQFFARGALVDIKDGKPGFILRHGGEVKGITSMLTSTKNIEVVVLATKERGYGIKMMQEICRIASEKNKGVSLTSTKESTGFYEKMGMKKGPKVPYLRSSNLFTFTKQETSDFAKRKL